MIMNKPQYAFKPLQEKKIDDLVIKKNCIVSTWWITAGTWSLEKVDGNKATHGTDIVLGSANANTKHHMSKSLEENKNAQSPWTADTIALSNFYNRPEEYF